MTSAPARVSSPYSRPPPPPGNSPRGDHTQNILRKEGLGTQLCQLGAETLPCSHSPGPARMGPAQVCNTYLHTYANTYTYVCMHTCMPVHTHTHTAGRGHLSLLTRKSSDIITLMQLRWGRRRKGRPCMALPCVNPHSIDLFLVEKLSASFQVWDI